MSIRRKISWNVCFVFLVALLIFVPSPVHPESSPPPEASVDSVDAASVPIEPTLEKASAGQSMLLSSPGDSSTGNSWTNMKIGISNFTGAATTSIPIEVPPGRNGVAPNLALTYISQKGNGWLGVGWDLDMGSIQRSTKFGVNYSANDFVAMANGSSSELVPRGAWGSNYYGAKIEGAFLKHYYNTTTGGWEVTAKNGTKYYYGTTAASRQDNAALVYKWCLDKVQDTNGNYLTVGYVKNQGEIYPDRIDYTGNQSLSPANYVKFWREPRADAPTLYVPNFGVTTAYRLKTIEVGASGQIVRAYKMIYTTSGSTSRSILSNVQLYGDDVRLDTGIIVSGTMLPVFSASYDPGGTGLSVPDYSYPALPATISGGYATYHTTPGYMFWGDFNGDGKADYMWRPYNGDGRWLVA